MTVIDLKHHFGIAIKSKRSDLGISQEELADRSGLHRTYISDVERGVRNPSLESIEKLAAALELSVSGLFRRAGEGKAPGRAVEVLLVEDNLADIELTLRAFRKGGLTNPIRVISDGEAALSFIFGDGGRSVWGGPLRPGIILLDLRLPKLSGLEVLRRIKSDKRTQRIPVIIVTASQKDVDIEECTRLGVEQYLVKPVDFQNFSLVAPKLQFEWELLHPR